MASSGVPGWQVLEYRIVVGRGRRQEQFRVRRPWDRSGPGEWRLREDLVGDWQAVLNFFEMDVTGVFYKERKELVKRVVEASVDLDAARVKANKEVAELEVRLAPYAAKGLKGVAEIRDQMERELEGVKVRDAAEKRLADVMAEVDAFRLRRRNTLGFWLLARRRSICEQRALWRLSEGWENLDGSLPDRPTPETRGVYEFLWQCAPEGPATWDWAEAVVRGTTDAFWRRAFRDPAADHLAELAKVFPECRQYTRVPTVPDAWGVAKDRHEHAVRLCADLLDATHEGVGESETGAAYDRRAGRRALEELQMEQEAEERFRAELAAASTAGPQEEVETEEQQDGTSMQE